MKTFIFVAFLALATPLVYADCDKLSPALCSQLEKASHSLSQAIETSNDALSTAITEAAQRSAALYQASFNILRTSLPASKAKSVDEVLALEARLEALLEEAQADQDAVVKDTLEAFEEASHSVTTVLEETILAARDHDSVVAESVAFAVGGSKMEALKQKLQEALKKAHGKVKEFIKKAIEKVNAGMAKLEGFLAKVLGEAGIKKVQELLAMQVERLIKLLGDALVKKLEGQTEAAFSLAVEDTESLIGELEADSQAMKRSAFWDKVKAAVNRLGVEVRAAAMKAIEKHRPIIMQKLKELGQAVVNAGKDIVIEVVNGAIQAVVKA